MASFTLAINSTQKTFLHHQIFTFKVLITESYIMQASNISRESSEETELTKLVAQSQNFNLDEVWKVLY